jgi:hypothetical protein
MAEYKEIKCWNCDSLELHKEIDRRCLEVSKVWKEIL